MSPSPYLTRAHLTRIRFLLCAVFFLALASTASAQITFDTAASASTPLSTTLSWSHTVGIGNNRILVVGLASNPGPAFPPATSVTYGGQPLTRQVLNNVSGFPISEIWTLIAPPTGTANVVVTYPSPTIAVGGSVSFFGVDQTTPIRDRNQARGAGSFGSAMVSTSVATNSGDVVIDALAAFGFQSSATPDAGQTLRWSGSVPLFMFGGGSTKPGVSGSTTVTWNVTAVENTSGALSAISLIPAPPPPTGNMLSDQKAGSVLFYTYYTSGSTNGANTRINITNTNPSVSAFLHVWFQAGCVPADAFLCLTPSQTLSFSALDYDPDSTGYIMVVAVDQNSGCPINFNYLIGDEFIRTSDGFTANLGAEAIAARFTAPLVGNPAFPVVAPGGVPCSAASTTAPLNFNDVDYDRLGGVLSVDNFPSALDGNTVRLIVQAPTGSFTGAASNTASLFGILYDEAEQPFSVVFTVSCPSPSFDLTNAARFRIIGGGLNTVVGIGRTAWMRLYSVDNPQRGLIGAVLIKGPASGTNAFSGGHTLHKLTLATATVTIPIFVPSC